LTIETIDGYDKIELLGCHSYAIYGWPELPMLTIKYVIPNNKRISSISVSDSLVFQVPGIFTVYPGQKPEPSSFYLDDSIYRSTSPYVANTIEFVDEYYENGYKIAVFNVFPLKYIPAQKTLFLYKNIKYTIQYIDSEDDIIRPIRKSCSADKTIKSFVKSQVRNPSYVDTMQSTSQIMGLNEKCEEAIDLLRTENDVMPEFLIITNNSDVHGNVLELHDGKTMVDIFKEFAQYKIHKGIPSVVVTVDTICARYSGNDIQTKIHNFLSDVTSVH
jgi:hypothetical protein